MGLGRESFWSPILSGPWFAASTRLEMFRIGLRVRETDGRVKTCQEIRGVLMRSR